MIADLLLLLMTTQSKLLLGILASAVTGLLLLFGGDPSKANNIASLLITGTGAIMTLVPVVTGLDALLFKHKAEVSSQHLLDTPTPPETPATPETPAQPAA